MNELATVGSTVIYQPPTATFTNSLEAEFLSYIDRKPTIEKGYKACLKQFARWRYENGIGAITRDTIKLYRDYLANSGLATGTQAQYLRAVKQLCKWAVAEGHIPADISDNIHGAKVNTGIYRKDAFQLKDVPVISATIDRSNEQGKRLYAMFLLVFVDGLRTIEIHRANVGDLKTIGGNMFLYIQGKGHDEKDAPKAITPEVQGALKDYLSSRTDHYTSKSPLFVGTSNKGRPGTRLYKTVTDPVTGAKEKVLDRISDGRISTTTISTMFKECFVNAGYDSDRLTAHSGRHTAATTALNDCGATLYEAQQLMGHASPSTTEIYIHAKDQLGIEMKYRQAIYDSYFKEAPAAHILPELEAELMTLTADQQREILAQIKAQKGDRTA